MRVLKVRVTHLTMFAGAFDNINTEKCDISLGV